MSVVSRWFAWFHLYIFFWKHPWYSLVPRELCFIYQMFFFLNPAISHLRHFILHLWKFRDFTYTCDKSFEMFSSFTMGSKPQRQHLSLGKKSLPLQRRFCGSRVPWLLRSGMESLPRLLLFSFRTEPLLFDYYLIGVWVHYILIYSYVFGWFWNMFDFVQCRYRHGICQDWYLHDVGLLTSKGLDF